MNLREWPLVRLNFWDTDIYRYRRLKFDISSKEKIEIDNTMEFKFLHVCITLMIILLEYIEHDRII